MILWLLKRVDEAELSGSDTHAGFVICARTAPRARTMAAKADKECSEVWKTRATSTCKQIGYAAYSVNQGVVLKDFRAG